MIRVRSARQMHEAVTARVSMDGAGGVDVVVMAAAVADFTAGGGVRGSKIPKDREELVLSLQRTRDILAELGHWRAGRSVPILVGFAAETDDTVRRARAKLEQKQLDFVVANDVSVPGAGFAVDTNIATLVTRTGAEEVTRRSKRDLARVILDRVEESLRAPKVAGNPQARS